MVHISTVNIMGFLINSLGFNFLKEFIKAIFTKGLDKISFIK